MSAFVSTQSGIQTVQLDFNPPNLPLFAQGLKPFLGDYIDIIPSPFFVPDRDGAWSFNTETNPETSFHAVWTDNRRVVAPEDGNWGNYTPPGPTTGPAPCVPGRAGMRDQNIYTAPLSHGLVVGSRGNSKPLLDQSGDPIQRTFTVYLENWVPDLKGYQLSILDQPTGGKASFLQFPVSGLDDPLTHIEITVPSFSGASRTAFVTSTDPVETITVTVREVEVDRVSGSIVRDAAGNAVPVNGGLSGAATLNPDPTNPPLLNSAFNAETHNPALLSRGVIEWPQLVDPQNPALLNPALLNPALLNPALLNPALLNPALLNPALLNPALLNPALLNPALLNPALLNPALLNPALLNPALLNPALLNPALLNASLTDVTWTVRNAGNVASSYVFAPLSNPELQAGMESQLLIYRIYRTPVAQQCQLTEDAVHHEIFANILNPELIDPAALQSELLNPALLNATFSLAPDDELRITWRILNREGVRVDPSRLNAVVAAQAANTGETQPRLTLTLTPGTAPNAIVGQAFSYPLGYAGGTGEVRWRLTSGFVPPGTELDPLTGTISGVPTAAGVFRFTVRATDSGVPQQFDERAFSIEVDRAPQTIAFDPISPKVLADSPFQLSATATSGLPVSFRVVSGPAAVSGNAVTLTGFGFVVIRASQPGNANYQPAPDVDRSFPVGFIFSGFEPPLGPAGSTQVFGPFPAGTTVPVTWRLQDANRNGIDDLSLIVSLRVQVAGSSVDAAATGATPPPEGGRYIFNWNTSGLLKKTVYVLTLRLRDGSAHTVRVRFN
jgi:hypothetical protein